MNWKLFRITEFERLAPAWDVLNDSAGSLPFLHSRFIAPLCEIFGDPGLRIALCEGAQGPVAMAIVVRKGPGLWETFQPSQLPLGAWVMRPGEQYEPLLASLVRKLPGLALQIGVTQQDPACSPQPTAGPLLDTLDYIQTARLPVAGSFDDYWNARGKNLRHNMKRQRTKLDKDGITPHLETLTRAEDVASAIEDYGRLESAGWKAAGGTAIHPDNAQGRFYRSMLEAFCRAGAGRIYRYRFGDRVVAVDLCIEGGGALVIVKTTYDESMKTISPAFLMREEAFKALFEQKTVQRIEFYGKVMEWHTRWTDDARTLYHVNFYRFPALRAVQRMRAVSRGEASLVAPAASPAADRSWRLFAASEFPRYAHAWQAVFSQVPRPPVLEGPFIKTALETFGRGDEILAICGDLDAPQAIGIVAHSRPGIWETFQPSQTPLSAWMHRPELSYESVMGSLLEALPGVPLLLGITQKDPDIQPRPAENARLKVLDYIQTARVTVDRPFEVYWKERDKKVRYEIQRRLKRLAEQGYTPRLEVTRDPDQVTQAVADYGNLESLGWKGGEGTAVRSDNEQGAFYRAVLTDYCSRGKGRIYRYFAGDQVIAMQICIERGDTLVFLKTAYDETYTRYSPGILLKRAIFEHLFDEGRIKKIEFYGALLEWQRRWTDDVRTLYHVNCYRWPWLAHARDWGPIRKIMVGGGRSG